MARIAVVGGANMDIGGFPDGALAMGDSTPGRVRLSAGGVGRNVAENCARLGLDVELVTALGDDAYGRMLLEDCRSKGIGCENCRIAPGERTSVYLFMDDPRGDVLCAVNDMEIQRLLTPEFLAPRRAWLDGMDAVALDANLPEESIRFLAEELTAPLYADAVSAAKAGKLRCALERLHCLKLNRIEAELLTGTRILSEAQARQAALRLNGAGVERVYLTLGLDGAVCAEAGRSWLLPCAPRAAVNASGAGDAFLAALIWAGCEGLDPRESGIAGAAAAAIAVGALETVNPRMSRTYLMKEMAEIAAGMECAAGSGAPAGEGNEE